MQACDRFPYKFMDTYWHTSSVPRDGHQPKGLDQPPYHGTWSTGPRKEFSMRWPFIPFFFPLWMLFLSSRKSHLRAPRICGCCQISWIYILNQKLKCTIKLIIGYLRKVLRRNVPMGKRNCMGWPSKAYKCNPSRNKRFCDATRQWLGLVF